MRAFVKSWNDRSDHKVCISTSRGNSHWTVYSRLDDDLLITSFTDKVDADRFAALLSKSVFLKLQATTERG